MATLIRESRPKSRVPRRCDACGCIIDAGTVYVLQFLADGGDRWQWRAHEDCDTLAAEYVTHLSHHIGPWDDHGFLEWVENLGDETAYSVEAASVLARYHEETR